ncbi:MAG TPA: hypothetical protein DD417_03590 [Elusimicrobia bacterium]|nr:hypothetical protein [Elusimicrobiota bacterium]
MVLSLRVGKVRLHSTVPDTGTQLTLVSKALPEPVQNLLRLLSLSRISTAWIPDPPVVASLAVPASALSPARL